MNARHALVLALVTILPAAIVPLRGAFAQDEAKKPDAAAGAKTETKAQDTAKEEVPAEDKPSHEALIALRDRLLKAYDAKDIDAVLAELDENVVVTWQDATVSRGPDGVREYYDKKVGGPDSIVKDMKTTCTIDRYSQLYNDRRTAAAAGKLEQNFTLRDGKQFQLTSPWTATLVKEEDEWKIAAFHVSTNMFDNGVLHLYVMQNRLWAGGIAGGVSLLIGLLLGMAFARGGRKTPAGTGS
ncbi:MAG TPA: nuclear transport factor 2 family protein [Pirellulaceae bacterium]|nr:nuclear transport factor 2 family protein [Pirellulaceae bacterium]